MNSVQGLQSALSLIASDKIKDRVEGVRNVRDILGNRENLNAFGDAARGEGGAAWVSFYQCLFETMTKEKKLAVKAVAKDGATTAADKRLADVISLIRWTAERTVHMISKKPFLVIFNHLTSSLVFSGQIFPPAALDYAKALRALISYPPHLESLDAGSWKILMNICWSAVLGDEVTIDNEWEEEEIEVDLVNGNGMDVDDFGQTQADITSWKSGKPLISQLNIEFLTLVPILLSSSAAPILPPQPTKEAPQISSERPGYILLLKILRFLKQYAIETSADLSVLRSLNILLAELELNCRDDFLSAGLQLFPHLVSLWSTRNKALREQIVIALRTLLPYITHKTLVDSSKASEIRSTFERLMDGLSKETIDRKGIHPVDIDFLRFKCVDPSNAIFELKGIGAGFEFNHENAMIWAILELYADTAVYLYESQYTSYPATPSREGGPSKRRRVENSINSLILAMRSGTVKNRLLALQCIIFICNKDLHKIHDEAAIEIRRTMVELLDEDAEKLQTWAFIGLSIFVQVSHEREDGDPLDASDTSKSPSARPFSRTSVEDDWKTVWGHAIRKSTFPGVCRAACHAACVLFRLNKLDSAYVIRDIHTFLENIEIQGPVFAYDSICALLALVLDAAKSSVHLFSLELENKVMSWLEKTGLVNGPRGIARMEQQIPSDVLRLLASISRFEYFPLMELTSEEVLPDCAIVDRVLEERKTKPLRNFLLFGSFPTDNCQRSNPSNEQSQTIARSPSGEALSYLEGRPRIMSSFLTSTLHARSLEWENIKEGAVDAEKVRRSLDLIVIALSYQATVQLNGKLPDADCVHSATRLLAAVQPSLLSNASGIPGQHLIWRGFEPLIHSPVSRDSDWPLLIQPDLQSGIRQDLLPTSHDQDRRAELTAMLTSNGASHPSASGPTQSLNIPSQMPPSASFGVPPTPVTSNTPIPSKVVTPQRLINRIWLLPTVSAAFKDILLLCLQVVSNLKSPATNSGGKPQVVEQIDDDDFGEIRNAETDAMPLSKEALECQRTSASLLNTAIGLRLKGFMLITNLQRPYKDPQLVNTLLLAEGSRFIEIGQALCEAVNNKWLRLDPNAIEAIMDVLEEMLRSYAYLRDTAHLSLCLEFVRCSLPSWIEHNGLRVDLKERAIYLMCFCAARIDKGTISAWKVKLDLLKLLDMFLGHEKASDLWTQGMRDHLDLDYEEDQGKSSPLAYLAGSLLDVDARVRLRAATSASSVFYRPILPIDLHADFYFSTLARQPGDDKHFDSFVSHTLWKLNCCIATAQQRSAAVFHLYEIPGVTSAYNGHLQSGLEAVAKRLGLSSISQLYLPYAIIVIRSQLLEGQLAMRVPHRLYGFPTRKAYSHACLQRVGPFMLSEGHIDFYTSACEAAGIEVEQGIEQAFPAATAISFSQAFVVDAKQPVKEAMEKLASLPGIDNKKALLKRLDLSIDTIAAHLWELLDLQTDEEGMATVLNDITGDEAAGSLWSMLIGNDNTTHGITAIDPFAPAKNVIAAYQHIRKQHSTLSPAKMVFSAILRLTSKINNVFLVNEQLRFLKSLSLLIILHQDEFRNPDILQVFLREMLAILPQPDICGMVISMVEWGFRQLDSLYGPIPELIQLFIQLGSARAALHKAGGPTIGARLDDWIVENAKIWFSSENTRIALESALALWPETLRSRLMDSYSPLFTDLVNLSESGTVKNAGELCKQYLQIIRTKTRSEAIPTFTQSLFWHLKGKVFDNSDVEGITAFLEIIHLANGQIRAPPLDSMVLFSNYTTSYLNISTSKQDKDPEGALRASVVKEVVRLLGDARHQIRAIAFEVLQGMLPMIGDLMSSSILPPDVKQILQFLTPNTATNGQTEPKVLDTSVNTIGWIKHTRSTDSWTTELAELLCEVVSADDPFYISLRPLFSSKDVSLRSFLPHIIQATLTCGAAQHTDITLNRSKILSDHFTMVIQYPAASLDVIHTIIDTILHLRHFQPHYRKGELGYNAWLEIDYVLVSEAAVKIGAYATAMMFLELARDQGDGIRDGDTRIQKIMYGIYSNVEDPDGFYGIENHDVRDALLRRLEHEGESQRAFAWNGASIEASPSVTKSNTFLPALHNLHNFGFNKLANSMSSQTRKEGSGTEEDPFFHELAWRTGNWDLPLNSTLSETPQGNLYSALRAIHSNRDQEAALRIVQSSIKVEMSKLNGLGMEMMAQIKKTTVNLLCLREAANWLDGGFQEKLDKPLNGDVGGFGDVSNSFEHSFTDAERLIATRLSLLRSGRQREEQNMLGDMLSPKAELLVSLEKKCHLRLAELAKEDDNIQASVNAITAVQQLEMGRTASDEAQDAFSHVLWAQHEHGLAIQHAQDLTEEVKSKKPADPGRLAVLYGRIAHWTDLAKLKAASDVRQTFETAYGLASKARIGHEDLARICHEYATFADNHYYNLSKSSELERLRSYQERKIQDYNLSTTQKPSRRESTSRSSKAGLEAEEDERAIRAMENERLTYIVLALRMYAKALTFSNTYDDSITQLVSLWLQHDDQEDVNKSFSVYLAPIPTYKFIFLGPQLAARLYRPPIPTTFNQNLNGLLLRISKDHPFHILYQVITLAHGVSPPSSAKRKSIAAEDQGRGPAALEILSQLASMPAESLPNKASKQMKVFVGASVSWSKYKETSQLTDSLGEQVKKPKAGSSHNLPTNCPLKNLSLQIPIATYSLPLDLTCQYKNIPTLNRYRTRYMIAGGVHRPRIMQCQDSNGKQHQQLFKAEDEVRQDAVMEQVFTMTNDLLSRDRQAKIKNLKFRTYNVVPLPDRTGIIEFVEGTRGIGDWLKPAHLKYRNGLDISPSEFQSKMAAIQDRDYKSPELPKKYNECMKKFKPVLRHFFVEKHKDPMAWFTMRLNYSRSVAVTSIVGWMVGLGDRHCSNILIDQSTGELVHIDFGIVFEDGRKLRIPEKVPFRLTNDLIDGLGINGIQGTFKKCSENTLRVIRNKSNLILTILEVFKNDPLYAWAGDPDKLIRAQGGGGGGGGKKMEDLLLNNANVKEKADRILNKIKNKLSSELSIEYTVNMLIQESRDINNLSTIYHGWAPWF
ncbi:uncharacterized protein I206_107020 [Kwoniella pini CBS 10737]|uniref:Serine/threonine-protein kinase Tel1 n=1 Tax=Kwoniella pini CBS 10737 TaxID=1296096 RepID=A0AAJ8LD61_9TREE